MSDALTDQAAYIPEVVGEVARPGALVIGGMGGSALPALVLRSYASVPVLVHREYGIPSFAPSDALYIAASYSGNTEETLSFFDAAREAGHACAVVAGGGALLARAKEQHIPYVVVPSGVPPRDALLAFLKAFHALSGQEGDESLPALNAAAAEQLNALIGERTPIFYASTRNEALAYIGKITWNETAKRAAFYNVIPEMNHNELEAFDAHARGYVGVLLHDPKDGERIQARMDALQAVAGAFPLERVEVEGALSWWQLIRAVARVRAAASGIDPEATPHIEKFKSLL